MRISKWNVSLWLLSKFSNLPLVILIILILLLVLPVHKGKTAQYNYES